MRLLQRSRATARAVSRVEPWSRYRFTPELHQGWSAFVLPRTGRHVCRARDPAPPKKMLSEQNGGPRPSRPTGTIYEEETKMSEENLYTFENETYRKTYWHTCSHVLAQAMKRLHPEVKQIGRAHV